MPYKDLLFEADAREKVLRGGTGLRREDHQDHRLLEQIARRGSPLLIVAEDVEGEGPGPLTADA